MGHDAKLPSQSYFEAFEGRLLIGTFDFDTLARVVSLAEEQTHVAYPPLIYECTATR